MGKVLSVLQRKANRFNVENRAHKIISKEKPTPAPWPESTIKELERMKDGFPEFIEQQKIKDAALDNRLRKVFVVSEDPEEKQSGKQNNQQPGTSDILRPLPQNRKVVEGFEFGFEEPAKVPEGRCTLRQALKFITDHQNDPNKWTVAVIANEYKLNESMLEKVLQYYGSFQVYIPENTDEKQPMFATKRKMKLGSLNVEDFEEKKYIDDGDPSKNK